MKRHWDPEELIDHWTLLPDELSLVGNKTGPTRLGFAILLKAFQLEGRFPKEKRDISQAVIGYVAKQVNVPDDAFAAYDWIGRTVRYHRAQIREFFGFREATVEDAELLVEWLAHQEWVVKSNDEGEVKINRINYEICVLQSLRTQVRCKEIWVPGADKHRNPDEDLLQDFETQRERYYQVLNQPLESG